MTSTSLNTETEEHSHLVRQVKILLMDDDPVDLARYSQMLRRAGYEVTTCGSHLKALLCLHERLFDLVLVNQGSDRFAWRCVVDSATGPQHRTPVVVLTRCRDMVCHLEAMNLGAADYLEKPLTEAELVQAFQHYLPPRGMADARASGIPEGFWKEFR